MGKPSLGDFAWKSVRAQIFRKPGFTGAGAQKLLVQVHYRFCRFYKDFSL